jgi:hypothetical protein
MNRGEKIKRIGCIGEDINKHVLEKNGYVVVISENQFDSVKDMTANGLTVETKTLVKIKKYDAFCLGYSQWKKCDAVDRLFFIEIPSSPELGIKVWESLKPRKHFEMPFNNELCRMYEIKDLLLYDTVYNTQQAEELCELSPSKYR